MAGKQVDTHRVQEARWKRALCFNEIAVQLEEAIDSTVTMRRQYQKLRPEYRLLTDRITELRGQQALYKRMEQEDMA